MEQAVNSFEEQVTKMDKDLVKFNSQMETIEGLINERGINVHQLMKTIMEIKIKFNAMNDELSELKAVQKEVESELLTKAATVRIHYREFCSGINK